MYNKIAEHSISRVRPIPINYHKERTTFVNSTRTLWAGKTFFKHTPEICILTMKNISQRIEIMCYIPSYANYSTFPSLFHKSSSLFLIKYGKKIVKARKILKYNKGNPRSIWPKEVLSSSTLARLLKRKQRLKVKLIKNPELFDKRKWNFYRIASILGKMDYLLFWVHAIWIYALYIRDCKRIINTLICCECLSLPLIAIFVVIDKLSKKYGLTLYGLTNSPRLHLAIIGYFALSILFLLLGVIRLFHWEFDAYMFFSGIFLYDLKQEQKVLFRTQLAVKAVWCLYRFSRIQGILVLNEIASSDL